MQFVSVTFIVTILLSSLFISNARADVSAKPNVVPQQVLLRFVVLGDAEPKPEPQFPNMIAAIDQVNSMANTSGFDFAVGVGDIAHKGTQIQYVNSTAALAQLKLPFYPIMGNEEHNSTVDRFLEYANRWGAPRPAMTQPSYVVETDHVALVMTSPDEGRELLDNGINRTLAQLDAIAPKPAILVVHGAQLGVYPERADKGIANPDFAKVVARPNLVAVISGDLHMDMDRVEHSKQLGDVHYLHIPALERTKIPDESRHNPMFRVFTLYGDGEMRVQTYQVGQVEPLQRHEYRFNIHKQ